jgi:hypothetical protein
VNLHKPQASAGICDAQIAGTSNFAAAAQRITVDASDDGHWQCAQVLQRIPHACCQRQAVGSGTFFAQFCQIAAAAKSLMALASDHDGANTGICGEGSHSLGKRCYCCAVEGVAPLWAVDDKACHAIWMMFPQHRWLVVCGWRIVQVLSLRFPNGAKF